ncbi:outer membrane receptor protein involved in Fe transport [Dyadobacter sp. BE34]|uniref:Outer membrane receptor protein involved in Fe transport n=1 Tax=Dyadobacter fermentans TaxID=94254 RepID=A0ABU1QVQ9_9BACT|nr:MULTISPECIES: TonB-dependent receptor [Dyadobacter]MDR6805234.1 outer membrane receptor protein involved in Fe transport [Dyadobacter fermentans]MDR7043006.1 outer membrane receptor protein involved in Fe transport [Dyadobacter sp. BE242]MDR7197318.1 outer membrane receptor protein involved in Fe transport [Dyadobacter sp. BE34]MDR7215247.1 outer membrane receptor protein involved in Fe transport [Dyadobacter sp. BE31]MDR7262783.1 outer membrane receptor protein involved in Fe transport [Dy
MKFLFTLTLLLGTLVPAMAQTQMTVAGKITDQQTGQGLPYASVALFRSADSTLVSGVLADDKGIFQFEKQAVAAYYLESQYMGYRKSRTSVPAQAGNVALPPVAMQPDGRVLDAVEVTGNRSAVENKIDRQVYRAGAFLGSQGGTAVDVLKNTPSVTVNSEGDIALRGSTGFLVLVNGKPVQTDPAVVLNQIPANSIENVEIITSPSARYDPDGKSGIINITTKTVAKNSQSLVVNVQGGLPSVHTYHNLKNPQRFGADAAWGIRAGKWEVNLSGNYLRNDLTGRRVGDVNTTIGDVFTSFPSDGERSFMRYNYTARASVSYTADPSNVISAGFYKGYRFQSRRADLVYNNTKTNLETGQNVGRITYFNSNIAQKTADVTSANLDYLHRFGNKSELTLSGLVESAELDGLTTNINLAEPGRTHTLQSTRNPSENPLNAYRLQADYVVPIGKGKLETGYQYRNQVQKGAFQYLDQNLETGEFVLVPEFSSRTRLVNHIHSMYGQYSGKSGKLEYSGGLRYEYATRQFSAAGTGTRNLDLSNFFPSAQLQYAWGKGWRGKAGYTRRVQRTTNNELNPFPEREHSETLESGDPDILPEFIGMAEVGVVKEFEKGSAFVTLYNQRIKNVVNRVNSVYNDTIVNRIYTNAGLATSWGVELGGNTNLTKWWQLYAGANVYRYAIEGGLFRNAAGVNTVVVNTSSVVYSLNANTTFKIAPSWQVQWAISYLSKRVTAQGEDSRFVNPALSVKKSFLKGKLAATLQWQNMDLGVVGSNQQRISTWGKDFYTTTNYIQETDIFLLNLSYNLNQLTRKAKLPASEFGDREF